MLEAYTTLGYLAARTAHVRLGTMVSPATVRTHVGRAMSKLDARDRAQLVVVAFQTGLAVPPVG